MFKILEKIKDFFNEETLVTIKNKQELNKTLEESKDSGSLEGSREKSEEQKNNQS